MAEQTTITIDTVDFIVDYGWFDGDPGDIYGDPPSPPEPPHVDYIDDIRLADTEISLMSVFDELLSEPGWNQIYKLVEEAHLQEREERKNKL